VDPIGEYRAIIDDEAIFDYQSHFLGMLRGGYVWDRDGRAVAFVLGARNGPVIPRAGAIPRPPVAGPEPVRPSPPPVSKHLPAYSREWSDLSWDEFLSGMRKHVPRQY
jgi:hypothetical protein